MAYLIQKRIDGSVVEQWELGEKMLTIGRGDQADIRVVDDRISRAHCVVGLKDGAYVVQDLKSTNGTFVNNERITEVPLRPNDKIRVGQTVIVYSTERQKGMATIMGELEADGKGLKTYIGELSKPPAPPAPPASA